MRKFDEAFQVDGAALLAPDAGVELSFQDLDAQAAGRDEAGYMHRIVLREKVRTWGFSYAILTREEYEYMMALFRGKGAFVFTAEGESLAAYCAKASITLYDRKQKLYRNLKFNIIEC